MDSYPVIQIPRNYDLKQPILVINATDRDGTRPILKIDRNDIFMLVKATVISYQKFSKFTKNVIMVHFKKFSLKKINIFEFSKIL